MGVKFIKKKNCFVLTWQSRVFLFLLFSGFIYLVFIKIPFFLSHSNPVCCEILVLDGYLPDYVIKESIQIFDSCDCRQIITTGGILHSGYFLSDIKTMAELSRATFLELNFDSTKLVTIKGGDIWKNRTYSSALSLKAWLKSNGIKSANINVVSVGCHARRSEFLFRKALGDEYTVGVICVEDKSYNLDKWWSTSKGARAVISETIGYFYSLLFLKSK